MTTINTEGKTNMTCQHPNCTEPDQTGYNGILVCYAHMAAAKEAVIGYDADADDDLPWTVSNLKGVMARFASSEAAEGCAQNWGRPIWASWGVTVSLPVRVSWNGTDFTVAVDVSDMAGAFNDVRCYDRYDTETVQMLTALWDERGPLIGSLEVES